MRFLFVLLPVIAACGGASGEDTSGESGTTDSQTTVEPTYCELAGLEERPFVEAEDDDSLYAVAADFGVNTTEGSWRLSERWTGCGSVLIIPDQPAQATGWPKDLWQKKTDLGDLMEMLPPHTEVLFISNEKEEEDRLALLEELEGKIEDQIEDFENADDLRRRTHYVTTRARKVSGWLGDSLVSPGWGVGIDRFQRIRYIGSFADPTRYNDSYGWFEPNISMAANEAIYYDFEAERQEALDAVDALEVPIFTGEVLSDPGWAGTRGYVEVELPSAEEMATYDTMEWDLYLGCDGEGEYGTCPAWDYLVHLYLCDIEDTDSCGTEIGRWITTYHREGRWVHDVTGLLPLFAEGGTRRFAFYTQQPYEVDLKMRLSDQGRADRPTSLTPLFRGGSFNETYNDNYEELSVEIPAGASRVELGSVISGHGQVSPGTCAEFCVTTHHFTVNGTENVISLDDAGSPYGCMEQTAEGTVPNQYGTWWYGRSNWCPGKEVLLDTLDITSQVTLGESSTFDYEGYYNGAPYTTGGANIILESYLIVYEAK